MENSDFDTIRKEIDVLDVKIAKQLAVEFKNISENKNCNVEKFLRLLFTYASRRFENQALKNLLEQVSLDSIKRICNGADFSFMDTNIFYEKDDFFSLFCRTNVHENKDLKGIMVKRIKAIEKISKIKKILGVSCDKFRRKERESEIFENVTKPFQKEYQKFIASFFRYIVLPISFEIEYLYLGR